MKASFISRFQEWLSEWDEGKTRQVLVVVLAVLLGLLLGMIVYTISKYLLGQMFPFPPGLYFDEAEEKRQLMKTVAAQVFILIPVMWAIGTLVGAYCAARVAKLGQFPAWITGVLLTAYFWIDLPSLPNTLMLYVLCPIIVGLCCYASGWLGMYVTVRKELRAQA
ncbi:MAG: hypothetical protein ACXU8O_02975 [Asticcacaulis sp.]